MKNRKLPVEYLCLMPNRNKAAMAGMTCCRGGAMLVACILWITGSSSAVWAQAVALKMRAINPSSVETQKVEVVTYLPRPAKPSDLLSPGDFEVSYDIHRAQYKLRQEVLLAPKEVRTLQVEVKDVWQIPSVALEELQAHAGKIRELLADTPSRKTGEELHATVRQHVTAIRERQDAGAIARARAIDHIRAYESNQEVLERVRKDIGLMENLAIGAGKDPGRLMGISRSQSGSSVQQITPGEGDGEVVIRIQVTNPSQTDKRSIPVRQDLPPELKPADIIKADGLQIGYDSARNVCYAYNEQIEVNPQETRQFEVHVKNRWQVPVSRIDALESRATNLLAFSSAAHTFQSVRASAEAIVKELQEVKKQVPPRTLNQDYIAFYREQDQRIKVQEAKIVKLEEFFQPRNPVQKLPDAPILMIQPPSLKTTWIIIYIILGFLGIFSLLFFLRWYGKSKAESRPVGGGNESVPPAKEEEKK